MPRIHGKVWLYRSGLTLFGAIDTVWRTGIAVFGLCDAAKWWQCLRDLGLGHEAAAGFDSWGLALRGAAAPTQPPTTTPKCGHLLPTCRPRATMAT